MYVCMYVCMHACVYVYICFTRWLSTDIYVSQGDFRLMSFTAGRCGTPLIPNDQLRRNGVRSSDLIVSVRNVPSIRKPIATNPDRRTSEASPPVSDRKPPAAERREAAGVGPKGCYEPNRNGRSDRLWFWTTSYVVTEWGPQIWLWVEVRHVHPDWKLIATNPDRRPNEARPPVSDRKDFTNRTALVVQYCFNCVRK